jgi:formylglycine-generating enzyme required for sulfatase activity
VGELTPASRFAFDPTVRAADCGFRVAREVP